MYVSCSFLVGGGRSRAFQKGMSVPVKIANMGLGRAILNGPCRNEVDVVSLSSG